MKWLDTARSELGVSEVAGKVARPRILEYFAAAGHPEVKSDETAWCSAFVNFCMVQNGIKGTMSLAARSWLQWGKPLKKPVVGAVGVWPRGSSSWQGHVAIVEEVLPGGKVKCIGGNQGNKVSRKVFDADKALGFRLPSTMKTSRTVKAAAAGSVSTAASFALEQAQSAKDVATELQTYIQWASYAVVALTVVCFALVIYYRWQGLKLPKEEGEE